ncbi:MAG: GGDEF domain-containing protein [Pseudomonadota bacterium]
MSGEVNKESSIAEETVYEISKKVFANAAQAKIALTPEVFHIWYEYFAGLNKPLVEEIKEIFASGKKFGAEIHKALYEKYFRKSRQQSEDEMEQLHDETQSVISEVFSELLKADKNTAVFGGKLTEHSRKMREATKASEIKQIMANMLHDTAQMVTSNRTLQEKLNEATRQTENLKQKLHKTEEEASRDALTGLNNRKAFDEKIAELYKLFKSSKKYFSVVFVDIDFFKKFNDTYGHNIGDLVLQSVAAILHRGVKGGDFPARYGGEEFVILFPSTTLESARIVAEQLRVMISVKKLENPKTGESYGKITASFGVSQITPEDTPQSVLERADKALYLAKKSGRNNIKTEKELGTE